MCMHNDEDYTCTSCCYDIGFEDATDSEPYDPEYKNFEQVNAYEDGYSDGLTHLIEFAWRQAGKPDLEDCSLLVDRQQVKHLRGPVQLGANKVPVIYFASGVEHYKIYLGHTRPSEWYQQQKDFDSELSLI